MAKFTLNLDGPLVDIPANIKTYPFDYVSRYRLMAEIIVRYQKFTKRRPANILDVGGRGSFLDKLIDIPITVFDSEADDGGNEQRGDGRRMEEIKDGAYDVVISSDTLEHIPSVDRKKFIDELFRVSNDLVILCAPFGDHGAAQQEKMAQAFYTALVGHPHRWLQEHADFILPSAAQTAKQFANLSKSYVAIGQSEVKLWRELLTVSLAANDMGGKVATAASKINMFYNEELLFKDFSNSSYRTFFVASKRNDLTYTPSQLYMSDTEQTKLAELINDFNVAILNNIEAMPRLKARLDSLENGLTQARNELTQARKEYAHIVNSKTWKYTEPARRLTSSVRHNIKGQK